MWDFLLNDLSLLQALLLLVSSFLGSLMTAALGVGGGSFLIAVMATVMPPLALVPLHGIVQFGSNASRAWISRAHLQTWLVVWFAIGAVISAALSVWFLERIEPGIIPLLVALFILYLSWGNIPDIGLSTTRTGLLSGGLITTLMTMLVGATGPLVSAWLGRGTDRWRYTANFSFCMTLQHLLKVAVFGLAGFSYREWIPFLVIMILAGFAGTKVGLRLLGRIPEKQFKFWFKWLLTLLSVNLIWQWWQG